MDALLDLLAKNGDAIVVLLIWTIAGVALTNILWPRRADRRGKALNPPAPAPMPAPAPEIQAQPKPPRSIKIGRDGKRLVLIPAGAFVMGVSETKASEGRGYQDPYIDEDPYYSEVPLFEDAMPQHTLYLDAFWIAETPVSNAEYKRFLDAHPFHPVPIDWDKTRRTFPAGKDNHPVVNVSWQDANDYAHWVGGRLPTEAEWEKAASWDDENKKKRRYPWGNVFNSNRCNTAESHKNGTTPVDEYSYGASPYGVLDMAGNVWERTSTVWGKDWHKPDFKYPYRADYGWEDLRSDAIYIQRGGSWLNNQYGVRCVCRSWDPYPGDRYNYIGFRVAESVP